MQLYTDQKLCTVAVQVRDPNLIFMVVCKCVADAVSSLSLSWQQSLLVTWRHSALTSAACDAIVGLQLMQDRRTVTWSISRSSDQSENQFDLSTVNRTTIATEYNPIYR